MDPLSDEEQERLFDYCLGLMCAEEAARVEAWVACDEEAADFHTRLQAALGPLESLPPERCPEELAERTIQHLCAAPREPPAMERPETTRPSLPREDLWLCLSSNILMK
jgi:anti-sigma-K factor RskA